MSQAPARRADGPAGSGPTPRAASAEPPARTDLISPGAGALTTPHRDSGHAATGHRTRIGGRTGMSVVDVPTGHPEATLDAPQSENPTPATTGGTTRRRPGRRGLLAAAAGVWALALALPAVLGGGTLERALTGASSTQDPLVELTIVGTPTIRWTGIGRGTATLDYQLVLTGADSTTTTVTTGTATAAKPAITGRQESLTLTGGVPHRGRLTVPVQCTDRVKIGVAATGPVVGQAEVFTWAVPTKDSKGHTACTLI